MTTSTRFLPTALLLGGALLAQTAPQPDWSTYFGGGGTATREQPYIHGLQVLPNGHVLVCGLTDSASLPTKNAIQRNLGGLTDGFVACFDPSASGNAQLIWSTYLGGSRFDEVRGIAVAPNGDVVAYGHTTSQSFPSTSGCYQAGNAGGSDMFVARLAWNSQTLALTCFTYLGTANNEAAESVAILPNGDVVVVGSTDSQSFPMVGTPWQPRYGGGPLDGVIAVLDPTLCTLIASTYQGGTGTDLLHRVEVDGTGALVFSGSTNSPNLWTSPCAFQPALSGAQQDAFVGRGNATLTSRSYFTYIGGTGADWGLALALAESGQIVLGGYTAPPTASPLFPTTNGSTFGGGTFDGFLSILDPTTCGAAQLVWSCLFGGSDFDGMYDLAVDSSGLITAVGSTTSANLPTTDGCFQPTYRGSGDAFVARFDPVPRMVVERLYVSYYGGSGKDEAFALGLDSQGDPVFAGLTASTNSPVTPGAYQPSFSGGYWDVFLADLPLLPAGITRYGAPTPDCYPPVRVGVNSAPTAGNANFTLFACGAQPNSPTFLIFGRTAIPAWPLLNLNAQIHVNTPLLGSGFALADPTGLVQLRAPIPVTPAPPYGIGVQWLFPGCTPTTIAASEALRL